MRWLATAAAAAALAAGCTVEEGRGTGEAAAPQVPAALAQGPSFAEALAKEYRALVEVEERSYHDAFAAQRFLRKADAAQAGETVPPEDPGAWAVGDVQKIALAEGRARLMTALDKTAGETVPALAADAQVNFDCWVERAGSGVPERDVQACADAFLTSIGAVEGAVMPIANTAFNETLAREYLAYAEYESGQHEDWIDSRHFRRKGLRAANAGANDEVLPELLGRWGLLDTAMEGEYAAARERLMGALDAGAREREPAKAAVAQARFDCWLERAAEPNDPALVERCRQAFRDALASIETAGAPETAMSSKNGAAHDPEPARTATAPEPPAEAAPAQAAVRMIFFGFDSADIVPSEEPKIAVAADKAKARREPSVTVVGHADTAGPLEYNIALSLRRADAVRASLILAGVPADRVDVIARGESDPRVRTGDGVPKRENRRAEILLPGSTN